MFFWFYTVLLWLALPFLLLYFTLVSVRGNIRGTLMQRFGFLNSGALPADVPRIWFHAASVGEVRTVMELIHGIRQQYGKDVTILLSVMTKTGYEVAVKENEPDLVFFLPFDIPVIVRRVYRRLKPQVLVVFETELWPNLFRLTPKNDCRLMLANGRMSGSSFTNYRHFIRIIRPVLQAVDRFCLQTEEYAERYQALGADPDKIVISGNIKDEQSGRLVAKFPAEKVAEIGERIFNLQRMFNVMSGFDKTQDVLPGRFYKELLKEGPPKDIPMPREAFDKAMQEYYAFRGWDTKGRPELAKLKSLGIEDELVDAYRKACPLFAL